ncbi:MAG: NAD(P)/FAD-dependent oxidoreductase, partial [Nitrospinae bacterium]|nr:NAD(P)/FAD-dependent oxidoreductase [Nitrospinota bacterium]
MQMSTIHNNKKRESIEFDVLFIGGGPASLSGALHLSNLIKRGKGERGKNGKNGLGEIRIGIIEKGAEIGSHALSGAIMDPCGLRELIPDFESKGFPFEKIVTEEEIYLLTKNRGFRSPIIPSPLKNHGNYIISLYKFVRWLGRLVEDSGVDIFPGFPGVEILYDRDRIIGIRTGDKGVDKDGNPKGNFEPGIDIKAKVTVFGEGPRGTLTKQLINRFNLSDSKNPQIYSTGVKEVWEMPEGRVGKGRVIHTIGYPLKNESFGGGFIYDMSNDLLAVGFVVGLDYKDPYLDPHRELQRFKRHPFVASLLEGGKLAYYGAKTIPDGGYFSMHRPSVAGGLIIGDSGGFLNPQRLKGIHLAIKSGILAGETIYEALLKDDFSEAQMGRFQTKIEKSWIREELYKTRNFRQGFRYGFYPGMI